MSGKKLIFKAKFAHKKHVISLLSQRLALLVCKNQQIKPKLENNQLFISYIPSHWRRQYYGKWYNQSKLLTKSLANKFWIPMLKLAFKKILYSFSTACESWREEEKSEMSISYWRFIKIAKKKHSFARRWCQNNRFNVVRISKNYP